MKHSRFYVGLAYQRECGFVQGNLKPSVPAFTIIELLVIVAILALLGSILAPTMARTAPNNKAIGCLNNLRQLGAAWRMYAEDNRGKLAYNHDGGNAGKQPGAESWAGGWEDFTSGSDATNTDLLVNHQRYPFSAYLGPYIISPRPFKCPADKSTVYISGQQLPRVRSFSMSNRVGEGSRSWVTPSAFLMYSNIAGIYKPVPAQLFVFLDEREESINDAWFCTDTDTPWRLVDYPAARHNGGAGFAFADSHSEIHKWKDKRTMPILAPGQTLPLNSNFPGDVDVQWLQQHASARP
jgi:prepilin-type processing-associated H-X9-DG protein